MRNTQLTDFSIVAIIGSDASSTGDVLNNEPRNDQHFCCNCHQADSNTHISLNLKSNQYQSKHTCPGIDGLETTDEVDVVGEPQSSTAAATKTDLLSTNKDNNKPTTTTTVKQRPRKYRCEYCALSLCNRGQLQSHVRSHTGERPFRCDHAPCGKTFTRNEELTRHKRIHTGQRPFACYLCAKRFGRKDHLKKHLRTHAKHGLLEQLGVVPQQKAPLIPAPLPFNHFHCITPTSNTTTTAYQTATDSATSDKQHQAEFTSFSSSFAIQHHATVCDTLTSYLDRVARQFGASAAVAAAAATNATHAPNPNPHSH